jgi:hypothetical protein
MKKILIAIGALVLSTAAFAQDYNDVLRYSQNQYTGSARSVAMGSAFGALGGDFISASINPAGLGVFRSNEISFTPSFGKTENTANYRGTSMIEGDFNFNFNNMSFVGAYGGNSSGDISRIVVGFGFNQIKNFKNYTFIEGQNVGTTLLDNFANYANEGFMDAFNEKLAYDADLLPRDTVSNLYWNDISQAGYGQSHNRSIDESGRINEWAFALAVNMNEKLNIGVSIGLSDIEYRSISEFYEWDARDNIEYFDRYSYTKDLQVSGFGVNAKLGILYRPTRSLRLGAAVHTPTFYEMNEIYTSELTQTNDYSETYKAQSPYGEYNYRMETPLRTVLSAGYSIGKIALVSFDWEYVDYTSSRLRSGGSGYNFNTENQVIKNYLTAANNFRIGGEFRASDNISLRAGYEMYGNPYVSTYNNQDVKAHSNSQNAISAGLGYRQSSFFADFAYRLTNSTYYTEIHNGSESAEIESKTGSALMTIGFKF